MNDADRKALEAWKVSTPEIKYKFENGSLLQEMIAGEAWQAACEWRDSQVGEPVAWCNYNPLTGEKWYSDSKECVNAEALYANAPIAENQKAVGKFVWIETCDGGYWHHLYKGNEPPRTSKTVFLYAAPPIAQINQQMLEALEAFINAWGDCLGHPDTDEERFRLSEARDKAESAVLSAAKSGDV